MTYSQKPAAKVLVRDGAIISAFRIGDKVRHAGNIGIVVDRHVGGSLLVRHSGGVEHWCSSRDLTLIN